MSKEVLRIVGGYITYGQSAPIRRTCSQNSFVITNRSQFVSIGFSFSSRKL
ncbi:Hypothetical predicted protein, partial [Paramuricea clavata]